MENGALKHGHSVQRAASPTYSSWAAMLKRCANPNATGYEHYGGRGIRVCEAWQAFENFLADMGERPVGMTLDRIDVNGNYEPGNCRWATRKQQERNTRQTRWLDYDGRKWCATDLAEHLGVARHVLYGRIGRGWPPERWAQPADKTIQVRRKRSCP